MALRTKTIEYAFVSNTGSTTAGTTFSFTSQKLYIPETSSRTFRSAILECSARNTNTTAVNMTSVTLGIRFGALGFDTTNVGTFENYGESIHGCWHRDVTSYFNSNFGAGSTQDCQVSLLISTSATTNQTAKLYITYEYEDNAATTRIKTVKIPIESNSGGLTTTLTQFGTNQIPALNTFLPEDSKTYRNIFFEIFYNENLTGTTVDPTLQMSLDAEAAHNTGIHESSLASSCSGKYIWMRRYFDTGANAIGTYDPSVTHEWRMATSNTQATFEHPSVVMNVTYEYNHTNSTSIINSLMMPFPESNILSNYDGAVAQQRSQLEFWVQETGVSLVQSGAVISYYNNVSSLQATSFSFGSQGTKNITDTAVVTCGASFISHRIDSGSAQGSAFTLSRGRNTLNFNQVTPLGIHSMNAFLILNYTSNKSANGDGEHNHTTVWNVLSGSGFSSFVITGLNQWVNIPESNYFFACIPGAYFNHTNAYSSNKFVGFQILSGESLGSGYLTMLKKGLNTRPSSTGWYPYWTLSPNKIFKSYPQDPDNLMEIEGSRRCTSFSDSLSSHGFMLYLTYHSKTYNIDGVVSGYTGTGVGLIVEAYRADTRAKINSASTTTGGNYTMVWYDDTINVYVTCRESSTRVGRSDNSLAGT